MKNRMNMVSVAVAFTFALVLATSSQAAWVTVDDFESGPLTGWDISGANPVVQVTDPDDPSNTVLTFTGTNEMMKGGFNIAENTTGTLFYRQRITNAGDVFPGSRTNLGLSDQTWLGRNVAFPKNNLRARIQTAEEFPSPFTSHVETFSSFTTTEVVDDLEGSTWLNYWIVADNTINKYDLYIQGGTDYPTQTLLVSGQVWARSEGLSNDLISFYNYATSNRAGWLDDIYVDTAGSNLDNPTAGVPEPGTFVLLGLGGFGLTLLRRTRKS